MGYKGDAKTSKSLFLSLDILQLDRYSAKRYTNINSTNITLQLTLTKDMLRTG